VKQALCGVFGLLMLAAAAMAQQTSAGRGDETAIRALETKWDAALLKGDTNALDAIFADTYVSTDPEGKVQTKAELLAEIKSGEMKYQASKADDIKVSLYGAAAVVTGKWKARFTRKGKTVDTFERYTSTYVKQNGQWRCVASHGSAIQ
jgi:ketosteroid isomerase-like protein